MCPCPLFQYPTSGRSYRWVFFPRQDTLYPFPVESLLGAKAIPVAAACQGSRCDSLRVPSFRGPSRADAARGASERQCQGDALRRTLERLWRATGDSRPAHSRHRRPRRLRRTGIPCDATGKKVLLPRLDCFTASYRCLRPSITAKIVCKRSRW